MENQNKKKKFIKRIFKIIAIILVAVIILPLIIIFAVRGINAVRFNIRDGVQERIFITLGGIEQALHIRGENENNPVIIWLHGGPGWSDAYELAHWQYKLEDDYTFVRWDQRGSGRTYNRNPDAPLSLDILISDLDELVDYTAVRFGQPVYIVGDSWGSLLGITYSSRHPEKIAGFIGTAQPVNLHESIMIALELGYDHAMKAGNTGEAEQMKAVTGRIGNKGFSDDDFDFNDMVLAQGLPAKYLAPGGESQGFGIFFSPWFGFNELRELMSVFMGSNTTFFDRNRPLFDSFDSYVPPERLEVPVAFIMGSKDYITVTSLVEDYYAGVEAPSKNMFIIEGSGHASYRSQPDVFVEKLREALAGFNT